MVEKVLLELIEDLYKIGPLASLGMVAAAFTIGIVASLVADARDPDIEAKRAERAERTTAEREPEPAARD